MSAKSPRSPRESTLKRRRAKDADMWLYSTKLEMQSVKGDVPAAFNERASARSKYKFSWTMFMGFCIWWVSMLIAYYAQFALNADLMWVPWAVCLSLHVGIVVALLTPARDLPRPRIFPLNSRLFNLSFFLGLPFGVDTFLPSDAELPIAVIQRINAFNFAFVGFVALILLNTMLCMFLPLLTSKTIYSAIFADVAELAWLDGGRSVFDLCGEQAQSFSARYSDCGQALMLLGFLSVLIFLSLLAGSISIPWRPSDEELEERKKRWIVLGQSNGLYRLAEEVELVAEGGTTRTKDAVWWSFVVFYPMATLAIIATMMTVAFRYFLTDPDIEHMSALIVLVVVSTVSMAIQIMILVVLSAEFVRFYYRRARDRMQYLAFRLEHALHHLEKSRLFMRIMQLRILFDVEMTPQEYTAPGLLVAAYFVVAFVMSAWNAFVFVTRGRLFVAEIVNVFGSAALVIGMLIQLRIATQSAAAVTEQRKAVATRALMLSRSVVSPNLSATEVEEDDRLCALLDRFVKYSDEFATMPNVLGIVVKPTVYRVIAAYFASSFGAFLVAAFSI